MKRGGYLDYLEAAGLWLLEATINYGLGVWFLVKVLIWVATWTLIGAFVLEFSKAPGRRLLFWRLGASSDHLLPIVELNKEFTDYFNDSNRERLHRFQLAYFAVHALVGFLLGSFVLAGLTGLIHPA